MVINCVPGHFPCLIGTVFQVKLAKKRPKMVHLQIDRFGAQRKVQIQNHKYFCVLQDLNVQPIECWLKTFHKFGAMISSKIDPFRPISNISNYLTISPIISPNFQTRSKYLYGSSKGSLKCNKSVNSFLTHIISALKIRKNRKNRPISPPLTVGRTTFWKIKKLGL